MRNRIATLFFVVSFLFCGCAVNGIITDFNNKTTFVKRLYIEEPGTIRIHDGNAVREVQLKQIKSLGITVNESKIFNREMYYPAKITFLDGSTIGNSEENPSNAYVAGNRMLFGKAKGIKYQIMLNDVSKIEFGVE